MKLDRRRLRKHPNDVGWWYFRTQEYAELILAHLCMRGNKVEVSNEEGWDDTEATMAPANKVVPVEWLDDGFMEEADVMYVNLSKDNNDDQELGVWQVHEDSYESYYNYLEKLNEQE